MRLSEPETAPVWSSGGGRKGHTGLSPCADNSQDGQPPPPTPRYKKEKLRAVGRPANTPGYSVPCRSCTNIPSACWLWREAHSPSAAQLPGELPSRALRSLPLPLQLLQEAPRRRPALPWRPNFEGGASLNSDCWSLPVCCPPEPCLAACSRNPEWPLRGPLPPRPRG